MGKQIDHQEKLKIQKKMKIGEKIGNWKEIKNKNWEKKNENRGKN